jgi:adenosylcobinamide-phosphate synthase
MLLPLLFAAALLLALAIDHWLGEPPVRLHPVVWMGNYLGWAGAWVAPAAGTHAVDGPDLKHFWLGALAWCAGAAMVYVATRVLQDAIIALPRYLFGAQHGSAVTGTGTGTVAGIALSALLLGLALKPLLAWAMLKSEVQAVEAALGESLQAGRERLGWLVSRDVAALTEAQVRESAIESLAENLNDSVVAPIFWFVLLGLPGAALYRFANTADAMWGYRGVRNGQVWEWGGKWAAWADDCLSWLPARITAALLAMVSGGFSVRALQQEARRTPSPNSGWPMAAMALGLGVCLHKPGVYALNAPGRSPQAADTQQAIVYASKAVVALVSCALIAMLLIAIVLMTVKGLS